MTSEYPVDGAQWTIDSIPFDRIDFARVRDDRHLFYLLASASFIEITSDLYTRNLIEFFGDDQETTEWLRDGWEPDEVRHGMALKRYVQTVWPEFDWDGAYRDFFAEYSRVCSVEALAPKPALELVERCVVETGTSSFYRMIQNAEFEPVLTQLVGNIAADEVRHYRHFYRYFQRYRDRDGQGRLAILRRLYERATEVHTEDALIAFRHIHRTANPGAAFRQSEYEWYRAGVKDLIRRHFPQDMAVKMILKPLGVGSFGTRVIVPMVSAVWRFVTA